MDGLILAGGKSSRMGGQHKGALVIDKATFAEHIVRELKKLTDTIWISYGEKVHEEFEGVKIISDEHVGCGPIEGIYQGLKNCSSDKLMIVACDMPFIKADLYKFLEETLQEVEEASDEKYYGIVPVLNGRYHTLSAIYKKEAVTYFEDSLLKGTLSIRSALDKMNILYVSVDDYVEFHKMLENINTREDYLKFKGVEE